MQTKHVEFIGIMFQNVLFYNFAGWAKRPPALSNFTHNYFETRMTALKKREKKDERKATDSDRKQGGTSKKSSSSVLFFARNINIIQE